MRAVLSIESTSLAHQILVSLLLFLASFIQAPLNQAIYATLTYYRKDDNIMHQRQENVVNISSCGFSHLFYDQFDPSQCFQSDSALGARCRIR